MKILIVSNMGPMPKAPLQGVYVEKQVARLKARGLNVSYFSLLWNGETVFHRIFKYPLFFIRFLFKHLLSFEKFDVVHIHYYFPTIICAFLYKFFRNPKAKVVVTCHGGDVYSHQPAGWAYKKLSTIVDHWFFTSDSLYQRFDGTAKNKTILCAGYDDSVFLAPKEQQIKTIDCIFVGVIEHNKGIDRLIWLVKNMPTVSFSVVGAGSLIKTLEACATEHQNLSILGKKQPSDLVELMHNSRFLLSLSRNESFGLVIAEAHACKTPCIVTETDGSTAQLSGWEYMVSQQQNEKKIRKQLKESVVAALGLSITEYQDIQQVAFEKTQGFSLSSVINEIEQQYKKLN